MQGRSKPTVSAEGVAHEGCDVKPRLLDLFCGAGGAGMGYHRAGFDVVGVDLNPQPNYPFEFHQMDALSVLDYFNVALTFDAIHASPPCQAYSTMRVMHNARNDHPELVDITRERLVATGLPWVIENVPGSPLNAGPPSLFESTSGVTLCGSMFGLNNGEAELRRHRLFESNVTLPQPPCRHRLPVIGFYGDHARTLQRTIAGHRDRGGDITGLERKMPLVRDLLGIDWMTWHEAVLAIPPAFTEWVGRRMLDHLAEAAA